MQTEALDSLEAEYSRLDAQPGTAGVGGCSLVMCRYHHNRSELGTRVAQM